MANTTKKTTDTTVEKTNNTENTTETVQVDNSTLLAENKELKDRLSSLEASIAALIESQKNAAPVQNGIQFVDTTSKMDKPCTIVHLLECPEGLPTSIIVNGNEHYFQSFGEKKIFRFADMQNITTRYRDWFARGIFTLGEDCSDLEMDFGIKIMRNRIPVEVYDKLESMPVEDFERIVKSINEIQRSSLAKTWIQRYYSHKPGYDNVDKIRILNIATNGMMKTILNDVLGAE